MNVPKLRFKEFNDEWKITTINEQCEVFGRIGFRGYTTNDLVEKGQGAISLSPSNIKGTSLNTERDNTYISMYKYEESPEIQIYNNDIIFVKTGSSYGKVALIEGLNELATINPQLIVLKNIKCNNKLLCELLNDSRIQNQVKQTIAGGTIPTLSQTEFKKYKFYLPNEKEQNKIENFLKLIDKKIELQTKKIEDLNLFKKGLNDSIIFKNAGTISEINDLIIEYDKKTIINNQYPVLSSTINGITIQKDYFKKSASSIDTTGYKIVPNNYITYRSMSDTGQFHFNLQNIIDIGIVSPAYPVFKLNDNINLEYFLNYINNCKAFKNQILSIKEGGTRFALSFSKFNKLLVSIPEEQHMNLYGNILNKINSKIQLEIEKLNKLQELKKGLMQNMFV